MNEIGVGYMLNLQNDHIYLNIKGHHTLVVSVSGALFAFGSNSQGQLGTGDHEDKSLPTQVCKKLSFELFSKYLC